MPPFCEDTNCSTSAMSLLNPLLDTSRTSTSVHGTHTDASEIALRMCRMLMVSVLSTIANKPAMRRVLYDSRSQTGNNSAGDSGWSAASQVTSYANCCQRA